MYEKVVSIASYKVFKIKSFLYKATMHLPAHWCYQTKIHVERTLKGQLEYKMQSGMLYMYIRIIRTGCAHIVNANVQS